MSPRTPAEDLDELLANTAIAAGPAGPYIQIARGVVGLVLKLIQAGHVGAELRKRLADGIQAGDVVSDEALADAAQATDLVDDYLEGFES